MKGYLSYYDNMFRQSIVIFMPTKIQKYKYRSKSYSFLKKRITFMYRVIHKSLRDFRTRLRNNQDRHGRKEHINK